MNIELGGKFPWVRRHLCAPPPPVPPAWKVHEDKTWYLLPDNRLGIVDHVKPNGTLAVRPITPEGKFYPNTSAHWPDEDRERIPEEVVVSLDQLKIADLDRLPKGLRLRKRFLG